MANNRTDGSRPADKPVRADDRADKNRKAKKAALLTGGVVIRVILIAALVVFVVTAASAAYRFGYSVFSRRGVDQEPGRDVLVIVTDRMSTGDVARMLEEKGVIDSALVLRVQKFIYGTKIYPGTYTVNTSMSGQKILRVLASGAPLPSESTSSAETVPASMAPAGK